MTREEFMASLRWAMNRDQNAKLRGNPTYTSEKAVRATSVVFEAEFEGGPIIAPYQPPSMQVVNLDALALKNMIQQQLEKGVAEVTARDKKETTGPGNAASRRRPPVAKKVKNPNAFTTDDDDELLG